MPIVCTECGCVIRADDHERIDGYCSECADARWHRLAAVGLADPLPGEEFEPGTQLCLFEVEV